MTSGFLFQHFLHYFNGNYHSYKDSTYFKYSTELQLVEVKQLDLDIGEAADTSKQHVVYPFQNQFIGIINGKIFKFCGENIQVVYQDSSLISFGYSTYQNILVVSNNLNQIGFLLGDQITYEQKVVGSSQISFIVHDESLLMYHDNFIRGVSNNQSLEIFVEEQYEYQQLFLNFALFQAGKTIKLLNLDNFQELNCCYISQVKICNGFVFYFDNIQNVLVQNSSEEFVKKFILIDKSFAKLLKDNTHIYLKYQKFEIIRKQLHQEALIKINQFQTKNQELLSVQTIVQPQLFELQKKLCNVNALLKYQHNQVMNNYVLESRELQWNLQFNKDK